MPGAWSAAVPKMRESEQQIGCHTFRASGIMDYLTSGGRIEMAQRMAGHSKAKTAGLYDRRNNDWTLSEVERIGTSHFAAA